MDIRRIDPDIGVVGQITAEDAATLAQLGYKTVFCHRPDGEGDDQPISADVRAAVESAGLAFIYLPVSPSNIADADVATFFEAFSAAQKPVLAYCRSGGRAAALWALANPRGLSPEALVKQASDANCDLSALQPRLQQAAGAAPAAAVAAKHQVVIIGGGAGGIAVAASLLKRRKGLDIAIVEPREEHYYQPGWTMVGGGIFKPAQTHRFMTKLIPRGVRWIRRAAATFEPENKTVVLEDGARVAYDVLIVSPGLQLDWEAVEGLPETLGKNGVTSNYSYETAPYTWELAQGLTKGKAIFTQPPMPIKCAGAPQKAMYLSSDAWRRRGVLKDIDVEFCNAGGVLFGVAPYVPALMKYIERYNIDLSFNHNLIKVDGEKKIATFATPDGDVEKPFDMLHVCPPQRPLDVMKASPLGDANGWVEVDPQTLRHMRYADVFGLGDGCSTSNAKTAAAVRKQAPVVAENTLATLDGRGLHAVYDGYGSCPLTVERGKIVLAEFLYGGKVAPSLPTFMINGLRPSRRAWQLKERLLPQMYWSAMFRGIEWLAKPQWSKEPLMQDAPDAPDAASADALRKAS